MRIIAHKVHCFLSFENKGNVRFKHLSSKP